MLAFANVLDFLAYKLARLRGRRFALLFVLAGPFYRFFRRHIMMNLSGCFRVCARDTGSLRAENLGSADLPSERSYGLLYPLTSPPLG